ncbi:hypothetical protein JEQ12_016381 [Ovis aries]|uniref:Uncharacterized protein n=1 Tax=Ovis aries TaxID=9940 RepID=A0A836A8B3_SHEEP|nr:hypothetical protein JEQ12_016381 [Ovis aries]
MFENPLTIQLRAVGGESSAQAYRSWPEERWENVPNLEPWGAQVKQIQNCGAMRITKCKGQALLREKAR